VLGTSALHLADGLDAATAAGVLVAEADHPGTYSFQHALVQEALLVGIGPMRRAALHAQVAEALERRHHGDLAEVAAVLAQHHVAAGAVGDAERTVALLLLAADGAQRQSAYREAERLLRQALETVSASPGTAALTAELEVRVRLGSLLTLTLGYNAPEVVVERRRALQLATEVGSVDHLLSALWGSWGVALVSGDLPAADGLAEEMGRAAARRAEPMLLLAHHQALGQVRYHQGRLADACAHLQRAVDLAGEHADRVRLEIFLQDPGSVCRAWLATVLALQGEVAASDAQAAEALAVAAALGHRYTEVYLRILEAWRAMFLLRTDDAVSTARAGLAVARDEGFDQLVAFCRQPLGWGLAHQGDPAAGIAELTRGREFFTALAAAHMFGHVMLGALAEAHELAGDDVAAAAMAGRAIEESRRTGESFYLPAVHLLRARLAGRAGRPAEAVTELETGLAVARAQHAGLLERRLSAELDRLAGTAVGGRQADDKSG
jgi:tetratricopeptide (TPR) repeat protein